jgi:hypothetical protein
MPEQIAGEVEKSSSSRHFTEANLGLHSSGHSDQPAFEDWKNRNLRKTTLSSRPERSVVERSAVFLFSSHGRNRATGYLTPQPDPGNRARPPL